MEFSPLGDSGVLIRFGDRISDATYQRIVSISRYLADHPFTGMIEHVPAYTTIAVYYDPVVLAGNSRREPPYDRACQAISDLLGAVPEAPTGDTPLHEIPVCYGGELGPDLPRVAEHNRLTQEQVVEIHTTPIYRVYLIGFSPGFPYLGGMSDRLSTPRQATPRIAVPAGSVGIAGIQTGIYPIESPGGWQLIGRTPTLLFDPRRSPAALLSMGDRVRFRSVSAGQYEEIKRTSA
jgi:inhibitor of KinA